MSSCTVFSCARRISACTSVSCLRSSRLICIWNLRFSRPCTSSARSASRSFSFFTSSFSTSCATMPSSFSLRRALTLRSVVSHSSVSSAILCLSCVASRVSVALSRRLSARWSSAVFTDADSMLCSAVFSSSWAVSCSIFMLSSRRSSSERSPPARATLRSSCWMLNSAAYSSSCWRTTCASSWLILWVRFLFWLCPPAISAMWSRSAVRSAKSSCECLKRSSFRSDTSLMPCLSRSCSSLFMLCSSFVFFSMESRLANSSRSCSSTCV
mmetsp:Transcript_3773/g.7787  ORF Transcript_3773/g.7787 Transcript_3773/m.7787 type:complete len:269 (-) Transcript_3773:1219-2025(-)